jgi:hypothetical protein
MTPVPNARRMDDGTDTRIRMDEKGPSIRVRANQYRHNTGWANA